jgi:formate--tetrahydrofolate ligase
MEARVKSGLEIAQEAQLQPITEIAASAGIPDDVLEPFGRYRAKVDLSILDRWPTGPTAS